MTRRVSVWVSGLAAASVLAFAAPASAQVPVVPPVGDAVMSPNVEYLGSLKQDVGLTTGARVVGNRLFVTSGKNISIYDITDPASPQPMGQLHTNVAWENEEVPTNGKVLAVSTDYYSLVPECASALAVAGCIQLFDVRNPANIKQVGTIPIANHTAECALDCRYFYGSSGTIVDANGVLNGEKPKVVGNWIDELAKQGVEQNSCHHIREIRPGVLLSACQPFAVMSIGRQYGGGSPAHPKVLATGEAAKFVHSARWPRGGTDKFLLTGGEENFTGRCELNNSEFSVYAADKVRRGRSTEFEGPIDQVPPAGNGYYADGKPVAGALGCSVHWFQEHPSFRNGGLVALSEYEDGVRFMQIKRDGSIQEQGYFLSLGSSSSSPKWAGKDDVLYSIDYLRGIDILRYTGEHYVPGRTERGRVPGTEGVTPPPAPTLEQAAQSQALATQMKAGGWSRALCSLAAQRN